MDDRGHTKKNKRLEKLVVRYLPEEAHDERNDAEDSDHDLTEGELRHIFDAKPGGVAKGCEPEAVAIHARVKVD